MLAVAIVVMWVTFAVFVGITVKLGKELTHLEEKVDKLSVQVQTSRRNIEDIHLFHVKLKAYVIGNLDRWKGGKDALSRLDRLGLEVTQVKMALYNPPAKKKKYQLRGEGLWFDTSEVVQLILDYLDVRYEPKETVTKEQKLVKRKGGK